MKCCNVLVQDDLAEVEDAEESAQPLQEPLWHMERSTSDLKMEATLAVVITIFFLFCFLVFPWRPQLAQIQSFAFVEALLLLLALSLSYIDLSFSFLLFS